MRHIKQFILERFQLKPVFIFLYTSVYYDHTAYPESYLLSLMSLVASLQPVSMAPWTVP